MSNMIKVFKPVVGGFAHVDSFSAPTKSQLFRGALNMNTMIKLINKSGHLTRRQFGMFKSGTLKLS